MSVVVERNRRKYLVPGGANYQYRPLNAVMISPSNTVRHELAKALGGYMLRKWGDVKLSSEVVGLLKALEAQVKKDMKEFPRVKRGFVTEAVPKVDRDRRVDLVCLDNEQWIEFETSKRVDKGDCFTFYV